MATNKKPKRKGNLNTGYEETEKNEMYELFFNIAKINFKNNKQRLFYDSIMKNTITFCLGPAGTGKSFISLYSALKMLFEKNNKINKIIIVRPIIESGEKLGFLPGDVKEKVEPFFFPSKFLIEKLIGARESKFLIDNNTIQFLPLAYTRGLNLENCMVVVEEAQNITLTQMEMLLTRVSENTKFIISGDHNQTDIPKKDTCLKNVATVLHGIEKNSNSIETIEFNQDEIVRHPLINEILNKLETLKNHGK